MTIKEYRKDGNDMAEAIHFNAAQFEEALGKPGVLVVDFWAGWCMPCKMLAPSIEKLAEEYEGRAVVGKVDIDEEQALAARYGVQSIPTVMVFKNGQTLATLVGVRSYDAYTKEIDQAL